MSKQPSHEQAPNKLRPGEGRFGRGDRVRIAASVSCRDGPDGFDEKKLRSIEPETVVNVKGLYGRVVADPYKNEKGELCHAVQEEGSGALCGVPERALKRISEPEANAPWREGGHYALSAFGKRNFEKIFRTRPAAGGRRSRAPLRRHRTGRR